ncbi:MAG: hypothetical protein CMC96_00160 [Flavobacteriales bacterium]|nr:hypothetical protein [Flavobacteriales bacterium]|tara:strand:+ start:25418 stop:33937 length:8520 start_codon:yes stop_codon:yes gene_type:complete
MLKFISNAMKKLSFTFLFLTLISYSQAQTTIWSDNFELSGVRPSSNNGGLGFPAYAYFQRTNGSDIDLSFSAYSGQEGSFFWAGEDHDGYLGLGNEIQEITYTNINISGKTNLSFKGLFAANNQAAAFENSMLGHSHSDYIIVEYSIDGSSYQPIIQFYSNNNIASGINNKSLAEDTNNDGIGDWNILTTNFTEFTKNIPGSGSSMSVKVRCYTNSSNEELAFDNFRVLGDNACNLSASIIAQTNLSCNGSGDGSITVQATNGSPNYYYAWSNGFSTSNTTSTTNTMNNLNAGTYIVTVTDGNACTATASTTIIQPSLLQATTVVDSTVSCNGGSDGGATASGTGGTPPFTYSWSNSATTASITGVWAGTYNVTITDNNGCTASNSATITEPTALTASTVIDSNISCNGGSDGGATASGTGGVTPYTYTWSNGATTASITGVWSGTYNVTITDNNGCTATNSATVTQPTDLQVNVNLDSAITCLGDSNGGLTASASGGTGGYIYNWGNGETTASITGLSEGFYDITVTDANGCSATSYEYVPPQSELYVNIEVDSLVKYCPSSSEAYLNAYTDIYPYQQGGPDLSYVWSTLDTTETIHVTDTGMYSVTVTDNQSGCSQVDSFRFYFPEVRLVIREQQSIDCYGDSTASLKAYFWIDIIEFFEVVGFGEDIGGGQEGGQEGGPEGDFPPGWDTLTYLNAPDSALMMTTMFFNGFINNGNATSILWNTGDTLDSLSNLGAGQYIVEVPYDSSDFCIVSDTFEVKQPDAIQTTVSLEREACSNNYGGQASISASGGNSPYTYLWSNSTTSSYAYGLTTGKHYVTVTDSSGCTTIDSVDVTALDTLRVNIQIDSSINCYNDTNGILSAIVNGGKAPYSYYWSNQEDSSKIFGLGAGEYSVTVTDASGCSGSNTARDTVQLSQPSPLYLSIIEDDYISCPGAADAELRASTDGGMGLSYQWSRGDTTEIITGVDTGFYTVTVTDLNGCSETDGYYVYGPPEVTVDILLDSAVSCYGTNDAGLFADVSSNMGQLPPPPLEGEGNEFPEFQGGQGEPLPFPTDFLWNTGDTTENISGIGAGTYTVTITFGQGCTVADTFIVNEPDSLIATASADSVSCFGNFDGSANVSIIGGTTPYSILWSNGDTTSAINNLSAGMYYVTITDSNSCIAVDSTEVLQADSLQTTATVSDSIDCFGESGEITLNTIGGTAPYTYLWSDNSTTQNLTNTSAGIYSVTVTDALGCSDTASINLSQPDTLSASLSIYNVKCFGGNDGAVKIFPLGGSAPYTFSWDNNSDADSLGNLPIGTYGVTVTDANGCTYSATAQINQPDSLVVTASETYSVGCNGASDGAVSATASGGFLPYTYQWSTSETTSIISGKQAGQYSVTVTDGNGCTAIDTVSLTEPSVLTASVTVDSIVVCYGDDDGAVTANASGGTTPYSYFWNDGPNTQSRTGLSGGTYTVTVLDNNGCSTTASAYVDYLTSSMSAFVQASGDEACEEANDGFAIINASSYRGSQSDLSYLWNDGDTNRIRNGLAPGSYSFTITDSAGCSANNTVTIDPAPSFDLIVSVDSNVSCYGGSNGGVTATAIGGTGTTTYLWSNSATTASITALTVGKYYITVTDNNGCSLVDSAEVIEPNQLTASVSVDKNVSCNGGYDGEVTANPSGGTVPYTYSWSMGATVQSATDLPAGNFSVTITDNNGCTTTANNTVTEPAVLSVTTNVVQNASCQTTTDGIVESNVSGGTTPYTYSWSNNSTNDSLFAGEGNYSITVTDANGCTAITSENILTIDTIKPTVLTQNINVYLDEFGMASIDSSDVDNGSSDACGIANIWLDSTSFDCSEIGQNTVTLYASDINGNIDSANAVVTVIDTIKPTVITQDIDVYLDANGQANIMPSNIDNGSNDACGIANLSLDSTSFDCSETGTNTVWLIATDANGNVDSAAAVVTVIDTIKPAVIAQNIDVYLDAGGQASITANDIDNGSSDNCSSITLSIDSSNFNCSNIGSNTVWLRAMDANGNQDSVSAVVTVIDTVKPTVIAQNINLYLDANGQATITENDIDNGSSDACGNLNLSLDSTNFDCSNIGQNTVWLRATDNEGNIDSASAIVTVIDTIKPTVITQNIDVYLDANGQASIMANDVDNGSSDVCSSISLSVDSMNFDCSEVGQNTVWLKATDNDGNTDSASAVVTVIDTIKPTVITQNTTVYLDANGQAAITTTAIDNGSTDNCSISTYSLSQENFACGDLGTQTVTLSITDVNGNVDSATATVTVLDTLTPQIISCPADIQLNVDAGSCTAIANWTAPTATDNCNLDSLVASHTSGSPFPIGITTVTYIAYDSEMNTDTCSFTIEVIDNESPQIASVPNNITVSNDSANCGAIVNWTAPTASDNCTLDSLVSNYDSGDQFPVGTTTVQYIAYDQEMNTDTATFTVTVNDDEKPLIQCINDTTICSSTFVYDEPGTSDNCGVATVVRTAGIASGGNFPIGETTITYVVTDIHGNLDSCSFTVTRDEAPTIANAGQDQNICEDSIQLNANQAIVGSGVWSSTTSGVAFADANQANTMASLQKGENVLIWTISNGVCQSSSDTVIITYDEQPTVANAGTDFVLCEETESNLNANTPSVGTGTWSVARGSANFTNANDPLTSIDGLSTDTGNFDGSNLLVWTITNGSCPASSDTVEAKVSNNPVVNAGEDLEIYEDDGVQLSISSNLPLATYQWSPVFSLSDASIANPFATPSENTLYTIVAATEDGCEGRDSIYVQVNKSLTIPTAFTPNNDGYNDVWEIKNLDQFESHKVVIYDGFGSEILSTSDYKAWDGKFNGKDLPLGSYYYVVETTRNGKTDAQSGTVSILR